MSCSRITNQSKSCGDFAVDQVAYSHIGIWTDVRSIHVIKTQTQFLYWWYRLETAEYFSTAIVCVKTNMDLCGCDSMKKLSYWKPHEIRMLYNEMAVVRSKYQAGALSPAHRISPSLTVPGIETNHGRNLNLCFSTEPALPISLDFTDCLPESPGTLPGPYGHEDTGTWQIRWSVFCMIMTQYVSTVVPFVQ